jgi:outer membrane lipoprotein SlyB
MPKTVRALAAAALLVLLGCANTGLAHAAAPTQQAAAATTQTGPTSAPCMAC